MEIKRRDVLCYLRYRGQEISPELDAKITEAINICRDNLQLKNIIRKYKIDRKNKTLVGTNLVLGGNSIWKHLEGCDEAYLFAATIGFEVERQINKYFIKDRTIAVILDAAATAAIESYCDELCDELPGEITSRFSCGYGDFDISHQKIICQVLDTQRNIGVFTNSSYMLSPQKSVTAVIGVKNGR